MNISFEANSILFLCSFLITVLITVPVARRLALYFNIIDVPDSHLKKHTSATPYLGGLAIFASFWLTVGLFGGLHSGSLPGLLIGTFLILVVGLIDDIYSLTPFQKFSCQLMIAVVLVVFGFALNFNWPLYLNLFLSSFWIVTLMNAFNLVDVMDGLAATIGICVTLGLLGYAFYLHQAQLGGMLLVLLGALLAFFYYNRPRATIYLGDAGSMLIGTILAAISLKLDWLYLRSDSLLSYSVVLILFGVPLMEVVSLILIRKLKKIPFYNGSPDHFIHYLKHKGWREYSILQYTAIYSLLLGLFSMLVAFSQAPLFWLLGLGLLLQILWMHVVFSKKSTFYTKNTCCNK